MKGLEPSTFIPPTLGYFVRLDGVAFHTLLKTVKKPFDSRITDAMVKTTRDLVKKFSCPSAFTCSDEITLIFPSVQESVHIYNGKEQKLASILAGYASARFNHYLQNPINQWDSDLKELMTSGNGYFDARVCPVNDDELFREVVYWRSANDCFRNAITQIATNTYGHKGTHGFSVEQNIDRLGSDLNHDYRYLFGTFVKKVQFEMDATNPKLNKKVKAIRTKFVCNSFDWSLWTRDMQLKFLMEPFWTSEFPNFDSELSSELFADK